MINRIRGKSPIKTPMQPKINATIVLGDNHVVTVDTTSLEGVDATQFHLMEDITVVAKPQVREFPGGGKSTTFRAISVTSNEL